MSGSGFDELIGPEVVGPERDRLRRVHDMLVAAGPPPEMPLRIASPPVLALRPRRVVSLLIAVALALAAFAGGWLARGGGKEEPAFATRLVVPMLGTEKAPGGWAQIRLGFPDANGNWQMIVTAGGLKPLPQGGYYDLLLTRKGKPVVSCGSFKVDRSGKARVRFGASYSLNFFDGWVVRPYIHGRDRFNETVVLKTPTV